jgi:hypothetical protein
LIAAALALALAAAPAPVERYAVVVGHNGPGDDAQRAPLAFADDDAARLYLQLLPSLRRGWLLTTFDDGSARAYPDLTSVARVPSRVELARVLGELSWQVRENERLGKRSEVLFYFAGHGDVDAGGEGFLVLADGPFTRTDLQTQVVGGAGGAVQHVVLDACASYFMVARGTESGRRKLTPALFDALGAPPAARARTGVLVSTSGAVEVHESSTLGGGVFSYLLRSALAGAADVDGDGRVEYAEAAGFIESASSRVADPRARLQVHVASPTQDPHAPLVDLRASGARHFLRVDERGARHVRVLDARGVPLIEAHADAGAPITLALVGNPFYVVQVEDTEAVLVPRRAGAYALSTLDFAPAQERRARGAAHLQTLLASPFEASFVEGYAAKARVAPPRTGEPFLVAFAPGAEPAVQFPWVAVGSTALAVSGALAIAAIASTVGNAVAFGQLQESFDQTRAIDPDLALAVEGWRTVAVATTVGAVVFALAGGSVLAWDLASEEGK